MRHVGQEFQSGVPKLGDSPDRLLDGESRVGVGAKGEVHERRHCSGDNVGERLSACTGDQGPEHFGSDLVIPGQSVAEGTD